MYEAFYGLRERPFNLTPDPKYLYLSDKHKEAFAHLLYGIKNRSGFVMISGEIGTGKTTLCRNMLSQMDANTQVAFIFNPFLNPIELLKKINQEFGVVSEADNVLALTEELNEHLLHAAAHGKNSVLVIDEAQNLEPQVLEQIRLLSNLETDSEKLLQIILIGQPELAEKLALHELRQLNQRITARYHLKPLNALETLQYIAYRIHVAGGRKRLNFTKGAIKSVYRHSGGVPRMINALCDRALLIGYTREQHIITARIVRRAAREIRGEKVGAPKKARLNWRRFAPSPSVAILVVMVLALAHYLVDPLDRFARELNVFNRILSGDMLADSAGGDGRQDFAATADRHTDRENKPATVDAGEGLGALQLVMDRLNSAAPARPNHSLAGVFTELDAQETLHVGMDALISLWNHTLAGEYPEDDSVETLTRYFEKHDLACEHLQPTVDQLLRINMPGLVHLRAGDNSIWMGIVRADDDSVTLQADGNRRLTVSLAEFGVYYGREFLVPWRDPSPEAAVLLPGNRGARVRNFQEQLHELGRLNAGDVNDVYDRRTEEAVIAIQTEAGLTRDGKAGPQVRLALTSWSGGTPSLRRGAGTGIQRGVEANAVSVEVQPTSSVAPATDTVTAVATATPSESETYDQRANEKQSPAENNETVEHEQFQAVAENVADIGVALPDLPVLSLPEETAPDPTSTSPDSDIDKREERRLFRLLREHSGNNAHDDAASASENAGGLMEVRELPEPFAPSGRSSSIPDNEESVTPSVFGSAPLVPSEVMRP